MTISLEDYEGHMALSSVGQAKMLADVFSQLLRSYLPDSLAVIGCAGGNGFERVAEAPVIRLVGIDFNPEYIAEAKRRYANQIERMELYCADIQEALPGIEPVQVVYAALVLEYVHVTKALANLRQLCLPNGILAVLLQLPKAGMESISPSSFPSLKTLSSIMRLVPPEELQMRAEELGFILLSKSVVILESAKEFALMVFRSSQRDTALLQCESAREVR